MSGPIGKHGSPGWLRLWRHSYRLGWRWLLRGIGHGWRGARVGICRLLVPLDPWRYYEMGKIAEAFTEAQSGSHNLDVSSPKLLASLLLYEGIGTWLAVDLFQPEIDMWRRVDPRLDLAVEDATKLSFAEDSFDNVVSVSVVEHIAKDGDSRAMAEMWRVLRPGGHLFLTTNVSHEPHEVWREDRIYGEASEVIDGKVFFERHYTPEDIDARLLQASWQVVEREYARQIDPAIEQRFYGRVPLSYLYGWLLRRSCANNFAIAGTPDVLPRKGHGVIYLKLRKPP